MKERHMRRMARNLVITLLLAALLWAAKGFPLPTMELALHRVERQHMVDESRIIWTYTGRAYSDSSMVVGLGPLYVSTGSDTGRFYLWPRSADGPTLIQLPEHTRYSPAGTAHSYLDPAFLLVDVPARTQRALLHLRLTTSSFDQVYTMAGEKQGSVWFFQLKRQYYADGESLKNAEESAISILRPTDPRQFCWPCAVELLDAEGAVLSTWEWNDWIAPQLSR